MNAKELANLLATIQGYVIKAQIGLINGKTNECMNSLEDCVSFIEVNLAILNKESASK
jgi:hypothetical protein